MDTVTEADTERDSDILNTILIYRQVPVTVTDPWRIWGKLIFIWVTSHERHGISSHQEFHCLFNHLFSHTSKKISKIWVPGPFWGESPLTVDSSHKGPVPLLTGKFPSQRASDAENVSMSWRHHVVNPLGTHNHNITQCSKAQQNHKHIMWDILQARCPLFKWS